MGSRRARPALGATRVSLLRVAETAGVIEDRR